MKPKNNPAFGIKSAWSLPAIAFVYSVAMPVLHAEQWAVVGNNPTLPNTVNFSQYSWNDTANWSPASFPNAIDASALFDINILANGPVGPQLQGTQQVNLNIPITVGNLTLGDVNTSATGFNGNGFYNISNGTAGTLTFAATSGKATLQKSVGSGTTDTISATMILTDTVAADLRTGRIDITGKISGPGGITRTGSVVLPLPTSAVAGGTLGLTNNTNSYTGDTIIEHGTISATLTTDIALSTDSVLGNSANPIVIGTSFTTDGNVAPPATVLNLTTGLTFTAGSDAGVYTLARGIDFSQTNSTGASSLTFQGDGAGGPNSNKLTLAGDLTLGTGTLAGTTRSQQIRAFRTGYIDITGDITQGSGSGGSTLSIGTTPQDPNVDGAGAGTTRFSDKGRPYTAATNLLMGTVIVAGSVPSTAIASPIGTNINGLNLTQGNSGNIVGGGNFVGVAPAARDTSVHTIRSIFMETAETTYGRVITAGNASSTTPSVAGYGSAISIPNGFQFGGLNTSGTITFSGNISAGDVQVGATTGANVVTIGTNIALLAESTATSVFSGIIADTTSAGTAARITINQFRNHPNLDAVNSSTGNISNSGAAVQGVSGSGSDGTPDAVANQLVGTAKTGTIVLSGANSLVGPIEVLGGTLKLGSTRALGWGGRQSILTGSTTVTSGTVIDLNGATGINEPIILNGTGVSSGGALINNLATPASIGNGIAGIQIASAAGTGSAYSTAPTVTISGTGTGATATASFGLTTASITSITSGGTGWVVGDYVNLSGGNGTGATARVTSVSTGAITGLAIDNPGSGYTVAPTGINKNTSTAGGGTIAITGNATNFTVTGVTLTAAGSGYTGTPTYTFGSGNATPGTLVNSSITLASDSSVGGTGDIAISAVVGESGGAKALTKVGAGILTLSAANTYIGATTVSTGTLLATNTTGSATGTGAVTVSATGTLGGNGTVSGATTISTGGTIAPGLSAGTLTVGGNVTIAGTYACQLDGAANGDKVAVTGNLDLTGSTLAVSTLGGGASGEYVIATYTGTRIGAFAVSPTLPVGYSVSYATAGQVKLVLGAASDYDTWASGFSLPIPGNGDPNVDADNDGLKNQQEYAFGLIPSSGSSVTPVTSQLNKTTGLFSYSRRKPSLTGLVYTYEYSTTLGGWTSFTPDSTTSNSGDPVEIITVDVPNALLANPAIFVRVVAK